MIESRSVAAGSLAKAASTSVMSRSSTPGRSLIAAAASWLARPGTSSPAGAPGGRLEAFLVAQRAADLGLELVMEHRQAARQASAGQRRVVGEEAREQLVE